MIAMQKKLPRLKRFSRRKGSKAVRGKSISEATISVASLRAISRDAREANPESFLDQHGVRHFTGEVFEKLRALRFTDTLIFMSSSFAARFKETPEINRYLNARQIFPETTHYYHVHRAMTEYFRSLIPAGEEYYLIPYSFKSGSNIFGIIFGLRQCQRRREIPRSGVEARQTDGRGEFPDRRRSDDPSAPQLWTDWDNRQRFRCSSRHLNESFWMAN